MYLFPKISVSTHMCADMADRSVGFHLDTVIFEFLLLCDEDGHEYLSVDCKKIKNN